MKKSFSTYIIIWAICLAVFNLVTFVVPASVNQYKFEAPFWIGYAFSMVGFALQLLCAFFAFKAQRSENFLYRFPLIGISYTGLIIMLIVCAVCMVTPIPWWISLIACVVILAISAISILKANTAVNAVEEVGRNVRARTLTIRLLSADAQALMNTTTDEALRAQTKRVYEAIRYSDPMSDPALAEIEAQIERQFADFSAAVREQDLNLATQSAAALSELLERRNMRCKILK